MSTSNHAVSDNNIVNIHELWMDDKTRPQAIKLLVEYYALLEKQIPDPSQRESLEGWARRMYRQIGMIDPIPSVWTSISVKVDPQTGHVLHGMTAEYYPENGTGLLTYHAGQDAKNPHFKEMLEHSEAEFRKAYDTHTNETSTNRPRAPEGSERFNLQPLSMMLWETPTPHANHGVTQLPFLHWEPPKEPGEGYTQMELLTTKPLHEMKSEDYQYLLDRTRSYYETIIGEYVFGEDALKKRIDADVCMKAEVAQLEALVKNPELTRKELEEMPEVKAAEKHVTSHKEPKAAASTQVEETEEKIPEHTLKTEAARYARVLKELPVVGEYDKTTQSRLKSPDHDLAHQFVKLFQRVQAFVNGGQHTSENFIASVERIAQGGEAASQADFETIHAVHEKIKGYAKGRLPGIIEHGLPFAPEHLQMMVPYLNDIVEQGKQLFPTLGQAQGPIR